MTVQDIITRVQSELQDALGSRTSDWADADYILSKLVTCSDDIGIRLQVLDLDYNSNEVILPNVPANTLDLSIYQASGQPLAQMILPKSLEWRLVGQTQQDWQPVAPVDKLTDTDTGTGEGGPITSDDPTVESWEWRQGKLHISPCMTAVDLRIRFVSTIISLANNSQQQILGLTNVYVYKCCEKIAASRSLGMTNLPAYFNKCFEKACGDFEALSSKLKQAKVFRLGGRRSGSNSGWGSEWRPPITG